MPSSNPAASKLRGGKKSRGTSLPQLRSSRRPGAGSPQLPRRPAARVVGEDVIDLGIGNAEALRYAELCHDVLNAAMATGGAHKFPDSISFRTSFSIIRSETALRRRSFSFSRTFSRFGLVALQPAALLVLQRLKSPPRGGPLFRGQASDTLRIKTKQELDFNKLNQRELINYFIVFREIMK